MAELKAKLAIGDILVNAAVGRSSTVSAYNMPNRSVPRRTIVILSYILIAMGYVTSGTSSSVILGSNLCGLAGCVFWRSDVTMVCALSCGDASGLNLSFYLFE